MSKKRKSKAPPVAVLLDARMWKQLLGLVAGLEAELHAARDLVAQLAQLGEQARSRKRPSREKPPVELVKPISEATPPAAAAVVEAPAGTPSGNGLLPFTEGPYGERS